MGAVDVESLQQQQQVEDASLRRIILDALPREKFKPLVSEYGAYITVMHAAAVEETALEVPTTAKLVHQRFPNGVSVGLMM